MNLLDRLLGRTGTRRRTPRTWADMEQRVATMDDQDTLIANLVQQRDEQRSLAAAAGAQLADFRQRVTTAETAAEQARRDTIRARADLANRTAISVPMYGDGATTQELHLPIAEVMSLQARGAA